MSQLGSLTWAHPLGLAGAGRGSPWECAHLQGSGHEVCERAQGMAPGRGRATLSCPGNGTGTGRPSSLKCLPPSLYCLQLLHISPLSIQVMKLETRVLLYRFFFQPKCQPVPNSTAPCKASGPRQLPCACPLPASQRSPTFLLSSLFLPAPGGCFSSAALAPSLLCLKTCWILLKNIVKPPQGTVNKPTPLSAPCTSRHRARTLCPSPGRLLSFKGLESCWLWSHTALT